VNDNQHTLDIFAVTAPGLEQLCTAELRGLGIAAAAEDGGAAWRGDAPSLWRANLCSRTASRVIVRAGSFRARTFAELERHTARLPWPLYLRRGDRAALRVTSRKSKLYHTGAIVERIAHILASDFGVHAEAARRDDDEDDVVAGRLVVVRIVRDDVTVSVDSSGALLHLRGYRQALAKAPLRETIAAAMLQASGWHATTPLLDPLCGSGTIAIEAALMARNIPPGLASEAHTPRRFAFEQWPGFDAAAFRALLADTRAAILPAAAVTIAAADRNAGAIAAATANAARAGVAGDIVFEQRPLQALPLATGTGHLITNPPYGVRVGERTELQPLYTTLGRLARERLPAWTVAFLAAEDRLAAATGLPLRELFATRNGGIPVRLLSAQIPAAAAP
jgi:putative N6-adenine-specific DNA methylase